MKQSKSKFQWQGIVLVLLLVALSLWVFVLPSGFDVALPLAYGDGDSLQSAAYVKRILQAHWFPFRTNLLGAPLGATDSDYPEAEAANYVLLGAFGLLSHDWVTVANVYILSGFFLAAISTFAFLRWLGVEMAPAIAGSVLFAFLPYHFMRIVPLGHVLLASYWNVPVGIWVALRCWPFESSPEVKFVPGLALIVALIVIASAGIYVAFFSCFFMLIAAAAAAVAKRSVRAALPGIASILIVCVVVLLQVSPSIYFQWRHGANAEAAMRQTAESELYGLKLAQLAMPRPNHPLTPLRELSARYASTAPLVNENQAAALGTIGVVGLIFLGIVLFNRLVRGSGQPSIIERLALLNASAIALATIGGLGTLFSLMTGGMIRAYNRISIFIGLLAISAVVLVLGQSIRRAAKHRHSANYWLLPSAAALLIFGLWDQTSRFEQASLIPTFRSDREFFHRLENSLPARTMVYQLPYIPYPEAPPMHSMKDYEHFRGYLHTDTLRWSYGGMKGREGDRWLRSLGVRPIEEQIALAAQNGFGSIYLNRRAYADGGAAIETVLRRNLGEPIATSADGSLVAYKTASTVDGTAPTSPAR